MPTLLLIRHGDNDYLKTNKMPGLLPGIHLNEHGRQQAAELARTLSPLSLAAIYSSPLERAIETAQPLAEAKGLEIHILSDLVDIKVGQWTGRSVKALRCTREWKALQESPSQFRFPGGESLREAQERVLAALESIVSRHGAGETIAVFFHADPIKLAVAHYLNMPLDQFQRLAIFPGSVTILSEEGENILLLAANLIPPFSFPKR